MSEFFLHPVNPFLEQTKAPARTNNNSEFFLLFFSLPRQEITRELFNFGDWNLNRGYTCFFFFPSPRSRDGIEREGAKKGIFLVTREIELLLFPRVVREKGDCFVVAFPDSLRGSFLFFLFRTRKASLVFSPDHKSKDLLDAKLNQRAQSGILTFSKETLEE